MKVFSKQKEYLYKAHKGTANMQFIQVDWIAKE